MLVKVGANGYKIKWIKKEKLGKKLFVFWFKKKKCVANERNEGSESTLETFASLQPPKLTSIIVIIVVAARKEFPAATSRFSELHSLKPGSPPRTESACGA